ncbi:Hypothetical predicted protein [Mytilus galloprovincialis]|nr:Hypothetical predicted protein [Mytilus galloprovincialis]
MNYTHFNITWLWGNNSQVFQDTSDNLHLMRLSGYSITDLGINVSCRIEGQYQLNKVATTFRSNEFYVGIKTNSPVEIEKGGTAKLRYWLTVPLSCSNCSFHLTIRDTVVFGVANYNGCNGDIVTLTSGNGCDFETNNANWNASKTLSIKHRPNRQYGVQLDTFLITLEAVVSENIWTVLEVPDIKVKVVQHYTEWHSKVCSAYSDPHMTTFDGL